MACVTISGFPCSGKTARASELKIYLEERMAAPEYEGDKYKVLVLSDENLNVVRDSYDGMLASMNANRCRLSPSEHAAAR